LYYADGCPVDDVYYVEDNQFVEDSIDFDDPVDMEEGTVSTTKVRRQTRP